MNDKPNKQHEQRLIVVLVLLLLALCAANLWFGSVQIPASAVWDILCGKEPEKEVWKFIVLESRLPQMAAALLSEPHWQLPGCFFKRHSTTRSPDLRY